MTDTNFKPGDYTTRGGYKARIFATDGGDRYPLLGAWLNRADREWTPENWTAEGRPFNSERHNDLDLMPPLREFWVVAGEAWDNEAQCRDYANSLHGKPEIIHVREVRND